MIVNMEKLTLFALSDDKKEILDQLMGLKCVQMIAPESWDHYEELTEKAARDIPSSYDYENQLSEVSSALTVLSEYEPKAKLFSKKPEIAMPDLLDLGSIEQALMEAASVKGIVQNISEVKSFQSADLFLKQSLEPWRSFDLPLDKLSTRYTSVSLFTLPKETNLEGMQKDASEICYIEAVSTDENLLYVAAVCLKKNLDATSQLFRDKGGLPALMGQQGGKAAAIIAAIDKKNEQYEENLKVLKESLQKKAQDTALLKGAFDRLSAAITSQKAKQDLLLTEKTFIISGWVPENEKSRVEKALAGYSCFYEFTVPDKKEDMPVKFKNNKLVEPFEMITEMYGFPNASSLDPNPLLAPFFFIFFGMMLSDAGYGFLLAIGGFLVAHLMQNKQGMIYKLCRLIGVCGISTVIWGAIYGGWFGDVITQFAKTFFQADVQIPKVVDPMQEPMAILILSMAFGVIHILVGMAAKAYLMIRRGQLWDAICDVGFWICVICGLVILLIGMTVAGGSESIVFNIGLVVSIIGFAGILLTGGRSKPSIFGKITGGLGSLYDITSYFSDILSYSRILALGLATGVIAMVVNILATMGGGGIVGFIVFLVVFIFGHVLNLVINALGAYVHTSRLQYVEYFGKFYEGGGKPFTPFKPVLKYNMVLTKEEK